MEVNIVINLIKQMASNYARLKPSHMTGTFNLAIGEEWFIVTMTETTVEVETGEDASAFITLLMSPETFDKLLRGTWTGLTAAGRENIHQVRAIDFRLPPGASLTPHLMQSIYHLGMHFFCTELPQAYKFGPEHTRKIHGGNATALAYGPGVRFAYYTISGDEQINDDDTRDPYGSVYQRY
jgi:hypothetical protein